MNTQLSRRTLAKGAAWAAPVIAASAVVPAYASSSCEMILTSAAGPYVIYGLDAKPDYDRTNMQLTLGGPVWVQNLPAGVTVTKITQQYFIENHQGQNTQGDGIWFMGNPSTNYYKNGHVPL